MGWHNPAIPWSELERTLSGKPSKPLIERDEVQGSSDAPLSRKRTRPEPPTARVPYAELHAHSNFSFLDGASSPEELIYEAERLGLNALALTDHDGFYGVARFAEAAEKTRVRTVFGAELSLGLPARNTPRPDPSGEHLLVLARGLEGYRRLAGIITRGQLRGGQKGRPVYTLAEIAEAGDGHLQILSGCRKSLVNRALDRGAGETVLRELIDVFGTSNIAIELTDHGDPAQALRNEQLATLAQTFALPIVATNQVHYATPDRARLAQAVSAVRSRSSMADLDGWLPAHNAAFLRTGAEMHTRFHRYPGAVQQSVRIAEACAFELRRAKPALPTMRVPEGHTPMSWLRHLVWQAVPEKYPHLDAAGHDRIDRELQVIEEKDFPGYFLIVHGIVSEAKSRGILCQGRGSAAASAVCYLLGITAVDAIAYGLPFERFLATTRDEEPDIDVDFDSRRREEIIKWVYDEYGRENAAQVANVIQYRPKNAIRDMARALGYSPGQQDAWSKQLDRGELTPGQHDIPETVLEYAHELLGAPRHLGIHSGGMVLTRQPVGEVVPIEHARMPGRTVIQWDKDDAAWMGLVKFDLLGLGMLSAVQHTFDLIEQSTGEVWALDTIPSEEPAVYDMLCRADSIGVFQVESRAQMGLLPRLQPRTFYDLTIQIALIRPGPIQGGAVHPFVRRKMGQEPVTYAHPILEPVLKRTLGIPVFQEQLIQMATAIGDCTADDADTLRRAMGSKRGLERIESIRAQLYSGMARHGLSEEESNRVYAQIQSFAHFGFAEAHSLAFARLVYVSSWLKLHYPGAFLAGLLRAQPMGFYSPASLTADARRHGVQVRRPNLAVSGALDTLEPIDTTHAHAPTGIQACTKSFPGEVPAFVPGCPDPTPEHRRDGNFAVRLGLAAVRGIGQSLAERIVAERHAHGHYRDAHDLARRADLTASQLESLGAAGALECFDISRRQAMWLAGAAATDRPEFLEGTAMHVQPPLFTDQSARERLTADLWATGISVDDHPFAHLRSGLEARGVLTSQEVRISQVGRRIKVAGLVTHRQRPYTASGITFMNLEDEHGQINVICSPGVWSRHLRIVRSAGALIVRGMIERSAEGVTNIIADGFEPLASPAAHKSRDYR